MAPGPVFGDGVRGLRGEADAVPTCAAARGRAGRGASGPTRTQPGLRAGAGGGRGQGAAGRGGGAGGMAGGADWARYRRGVPGPAGRRCCKPRCSEHQKFFSVRNPAIGADREAMMTVANRRDGGRGRDDPCGQPEACSGGAAGGRGKFFWENDLRTVKSVGAGRHEGQDRPAGRCDVPCNKLGSPGRADRPDRSAGARDCGKASDAKPDLAAEAARVAKADLASEMVYEFPDLARARYGPVLCRGSRRARRRGAGGVPQSITRRWARRTMCRLPPRRVSPSRWPTRSTR